MISSARGSSRAAPCSDQHSLSAPWRSPSIAARLWHIAIAIHPSVAFRPRSSGWRQAGGRRCRQVKLDALLYRESGHREAYAPIRTMVRHATRHASRPVEAARTPSALSLCYHSRSTHDSVSQVEQRTATRLSGALLLEAVGLGHAPHVVAGSTALDTVAPLAHVGTPLRPVGAESCRVPCRIFREPVRDAGHLVLESSGTVDVEDPRTFVRSILEVMHNPSGNENEGTLGSINPLLVDKHSHRSFDDVPDVVLIVGVCVRPLGIRLQPPFGDGIGPCCFSVVCLENCGYPTHGIGASAAGRKTNRFASRWS